MRDIPLAVARCLEFVLQQKTARASRLMACTLINAGLMACGGGGSESTAAAPTATSPTSPGTPAPAPSPAPAPAPAPAPTPPASPSLADRLVYWVATSSTSTSYVPGYNITLSSSGQQIWRFVPSLVLADKVATNTSPSYAPSTIGPYVVDGRFFVFTEVRSSDSDGHHQLSEVDSTRKTLQSFKINAPVSRVGGCYAVVGGLYFYKTNRTYDTIGGWTGGQFHRYSMSESKGLQLMSSSDADNCHGHLMSDGGALYDVKVESTTGKAAFVHRDLTTGRTAGTIATFDQPPEAFKATRFAISQRVLYVARLGATLELWKFDASATSPSWQLVYVTATPAGWSLDFFSASHGILMAASQSGSLLFVDTAANTSQLVDFGAKFYQAAMSYGIQ